METARPPVTTPTRTAPLTAPSTAPMRRLNPEKLCPAQKTRVGERIRRELQP
jgi:hypothetical protein